MREDLIPPQSNHPLTAIRRQGVVVDVSQAFAAPYLVGVNLGGDTTVTVACAYLGGYAPHVGDTVYILANQGDYLIIGAVQPSGAAGRIYYSRNANITNGTYITDLSPPTSRWHTRANGGQTNSKIVFNQDCLFTLAATYHSTAAQQPIAAPLVATAVNVYGDSTSDWQSTSYAQQGGGAMRATLGLSLLVRANEAVDLVGRNLTGVSDNTVTYVHLGFIPVPFLDG